MTNLDSMLKSKDATLPTKVCIVKDMVFPVVMYRCESRTIKKVWVPKNLCFWTVVLQRILESPLDSKDIKEIKPVNLKEHSWILTGRTDAEAEAPIQWPSDMNSQLIGKDPDDGKEWRQKEKRVRGWDVWMASLVQWTWTWANFRRWWGTGKPGMLLSMGQKSCTHLGDWKTTI